jgi:hypothetical protein
VPKICFQLILLNADPVLEQCIGALLPYGKVIATEGSVSYFRKQGLITSTDRTNEILDKMLPKENVIRGSFPEKDDMMNAAIHLIPDDTDFCWMVDGDEIFTPDTIERILERLDEFDSVSLKPTTFFGGMNHTLGGFETRFIWHRIQRWFPSARWAAHRPPTVNAPDGVAWSKHRHWNCPETFFHYSYVFAKSVLAKSEYYATNGLCIENWFERVWLPWVIGDDAKKQEIENEQDGTHEWRKELRGDARTSLFTGQHPESIQQVMPQLQERFNRELAEMKSKFGYD